MKKHKKLIFWIIGILALIILIPIIWLVVAFHTLVSAPCDDVKNSEIMSSNEFHASYYTRNCGATTYYSEHVAIDGKDVFIAEIRTNTRPPLKIEWLNYNTLSVTLASTSINDIRVFKSEKSINIFTNGSAYIQYDPRIENGTSSRDEI